MKAIRCGAEASKQFAFGKNWRNLNHGSFGTYPREIRDVLRGFQDQCEFRPDKFVRYDFPRLNDEARMVVAKMLKAPIETTVLVSNASLGINTILRNLVYQPGDVVIHFSTVYGSVHKTIAHLIESTPLTSRGITLTYPCSDDAVCNEFERVIDAVRAEGKNPKIALFDTITSLPGVRMPFERLTQICRDRNVLSCIDGAHSIGHIPIDLTQLNPDFYVSNCHKWLFAPRGCCVMYVPTRHQHLIRSTLPTSHGFVPRHGEAINNPLPPSDKSEFVNNFEFVGTLDNSPYLCLPAVVKWRERVVHRELKGEEAIMRYCIDLARDGGDHVAHVLGTEVMENEQGTLRNCAFANVALPLEFGSMEQAVKMGQWITQILVDDYDTFIAVIGHDGKAWARLSSQIYLTLEDFEWAGKVLLEVCRRANRGEWNQKGQPKL